MDENICEVCGTRNEPGAQFCVECQSFLPWEDTTETDLDADPETAEVLEDAASAVVPTVAAPPVAAASGDSTENGVAALAVAATTAAAGTRADQRPADAGPAAQVADTAAERSSAAAEAVRIAIEPEAVEVLPGGDEIGVDVQIFNLSPIVDAFRVTTPTAPDWLVTSAPEVRLLPNSNEHSRLSVRIPGGRLVPAGHPGDVPGRRPAGGTAHGRRTA